ncbi:MAG: protein translocase subunit SecF [Spirochaetales bacterium]|nr:protein translocase subunit SecF [Spirochaetales bacterium]
MRRILPFIRFRNVWFILSTLIIVGGIGSTFLLKGGYNIGIDFKGGLSQQIRIAPYAFTVANVTNRVIDFEINNNEISYIKSGEKKMVFPRVPDLTLAEVVKDLESMGDLKVTMPAGTEFDVSLLLPDQKTLEPGQSTTVNHLQPNGAPPQATIATVRGQLEGLPGGVNIQEVGDPVAQTFLIRTDPTAFTPSGDRDASGTAAAAVISALEKKFGQGSVIQQSQESLGPQMAQALAAGSFIAIGVAMALMLVYAWIRFRLSYAAAAIIALVHDVLTTFVFVGLFGVELNTAVIAAFLTIIGFSINDTIVVYDRIRENEKIMRGQDLMSIMQYSISQTLNRTIITSLTVFIAIFPLFLFGTGPVKDFSFTMVFGIITGTYSTICIASPIAFVWENAVMRAKRRKEIKLYGQVQTPALEDGLTPAPAGQAGSDSSATATDGSVPEGAPGGVTGDTTQAGGSPPNAPYAGTGGPVTRVQRVLDKKKKRRH